MEDVAEHVSRILVMNRGMLIYDDEPRKVFAHYKELEKIGLAAPQVTYIMQQLRQDGYDVRTDCLTLDEAEEDILRALGKGGHAV